MAKDCMVQIPATDLPAHPAARAWHKVAPRCGQPNKITILKETSQSTVYRMEGAGPAGTAVIAKRCEAASAAIQRTIYEDIFPCLPVTALRLYGLLRDDGESAAGHGCWLFLEDAGDEKYSCFLGEHRALAGRWLGALHSSAAPLHASICLPDRGPGYYLGELRSSREAIHQSFANPALKADDRETLEAILIQYRDLESHWSQVQQFCDRMPQTLVHGDLAPKNARIRAGQNGTSLLILDWGGAGWGVPAIDLAQFTARSLSPDLAAYSSVMRPCWPDAESLVQMAELGRVFRLIIATSWECRSLQEAWLQRPMRNLGLYRAAMAECIRAVGWGN